MKSTLSRLFLFLTAASVLLLISCKGLEKAVVDDDDLKKTDGNQRLKDYERRAQ